MKQTPAAVRYRQQTLQRLEARIPDACPLLVTDTPPDFVVLWIGSYDAQRCDEVCRGRFQVVAAFIDGFVLAWRDQNEITSDV